VSEPAHEHVTPAHTHGYETGYQAGYQPAPAVAPTASHSTAGLAARIALTLLGAAGLIVGAFMNWIGGTRGVRLDDRALYQTTFTTTGQFWRTVGFAMIVLGLLAIVGLAPRSGWLTRLAGVLGVVGFALFVIELYRAPADTLPGVGAWVCLAGGVVALIGGFLGTRRVVATPATTLTAVE
jgi:hypothetical protein